ncbi:12668_t:CDS:2 [Entrophospora sp. SA101]|nr:12668_t:CDS:2 [Entrophospora sp. SA101]
MSSQASTVSTIASPKSLPSLIDHEKETSNNSSPKGHEKYLTINTIGFIRGELDSD